MKSNVLKRQITLWVMLAALVGAGSAIATASTVATTSVEVTTTAKGTATDGVDLSKSPEVSGTVGAQTSIPKQQPRMVLDYVNQPPMVPHSVDMYQVTKNTNACLNCHSVQASRTTGAARISPTHFMDAEGKTLGHVAPRRYFCLQCHVPQSNAAPIVENTFKPVPGFGQ